MKILATVPCALLVLCTLGCSQQSSTASTATRPANPAASRTTAPGADVNTFGESKAPAVDAAAQARDRSWGDDDKDSSRQASAPDNSAPRP
ncbi:MAG TPA: hypothetical protein VGL55_07685 [Steroidobacteraceae bacterium]|jgi:hypothetical protein